ncbi:uncharacterized protein [Procambarus clarkii]|uniref:uncharacterized protein isoform X2 n=1 Tax=Procambarus clarkii TaxID=6728 RepID=UPI001E6703A6|nr:uncharacterized protein LOC123747615 isoform X2 [Procambarus clarkii]
MEEVLCCGVCSEEYSGGARDPVTLPCGHTFCRPCLHTLEKTNGVACPACRKTHSAVTVACLPPSYTILNLLDNYTPSQGQHDIVSSKVVLQEKKHWLQEETNKLSKVIETHLMSSVRQSVVDLLRLLHRSTKAAAIKEEATSNASLLEKTISMETLLVCEGKHQSLVNAWRDAGLQKGPFASSEAQQAINLSTQFPEDPTANPAIVSPLICCVQYAEDRWGRLSWSGNDLLLSSFSSQNLQPHFTLNWTMFSSLGAVMCSVVFLDLAAGSHPLGRVTIRLWGRLRRAQHFLGLCLGIWGATFKDSTFTRVHDTQFCRFLVGGSYRSEGSGVTSTAGLMDNLEWDGQYAGEDLEGQIVSFGGGHKHLDSVFGICVEEKAKGGRSRCPFGKVVSGLAILQKAATYVPSSQISISQCGVVINLDEVMSD